jgi:hypothetical protein
MPVYSVRCIFRWLPRQGQALRNLYEERITLWTAPNIDAAIELAETEALEYASEGEEYLGLSQAYALYDEVGPSGIEVFSLLRESDLEPREYLNAFFDTGHERTR